MVGLLVLVHAVHSDAQPLLPVFLHTGTESPQIELQESEVASAHWIDMAKLMPPQACWGEIPVDLGSRLAARSKVLRAALRILLGHMHFNCILLPNEPIASSSTPTSPTFSFPIPRPELRLWGITLGMTLSFLSHMVPVGESLTPAAPSSPITATSAGATPWPSRPGSAESDRTAVQRMSTSDTGSTMFSTRMPPAASLRAPSMAAIFPTFKSADLNILLYIFGAKYRRHLRNWEAKRGVDRRVNWEGLVLTNFYAALRSALVVSVAMRAMIAAGGIFTVISWLIKKIRERGQRLG